MSRAALLCAAAAWLAASAAGDEPPPVSAASIDAALLEEGARLGLEPAPLAGPAARARRLALDAWGTLPDAQDGAPRTDAAAAVDDPRFLPYAAERLARAWWPARAAETPALALLREDFGRWLEARLRAGDGLDQLAADVLGAEGTSDEARGASFLVAFGATGGADAARPVARRFLGLSWDCARCHDHPFGEATQEDFHGLAAFFARLRVRPVPGRQLVFKVGEAPLGEHRAEVAGEHREVAPRLPAAPALDGGKAPTHASDTSRRARFTRWLTDPRNPYFARAQVNRVWSELFGRGLVEPLDELDAAPDDARARLLAHVAQGFAASGFSLPWLYRTLLSTEAYARGLAPDLARQDACLAARPRPLPPETRGRALLALVGRARPAPGELPRVRAALEARVRAWFAGAEGLDLLPGQALVQLSDPGLLGLLAQGTGRFTGRPEARLGALFRAALSRSPTAAERRVFLPALRRDQAVDVMWALVSSSEFASNH
ncbi:MAG: DUF1553 domain-containing protein [Planctomycetota bacterium]